MSSPAPEAAPPPHPVTPASVVASTAIARTLTISDQHATILLTSNEANATEDTSSTVRPPSRSLLKLTLVPFHKTDLARIPISTDAAQASGADKEKKKNEVSDVVEKEHSRRVMKFLSEFNWRMTSESGAEYSFHEAFLKSNPSVGDGGSEPEAKRTKMDMEETTETTKTEDSAEAKMKTTFTSAKWSSFKAELISPASDRQVARAMPSPGLSMVIETPDLYKLVTKPFIDSIVASGSLSWLENVVTGKKEKERLLHDADDWILNIDTKWRTHPDALTVPRSEWFRHESIVDLYCLGIIKPKGVASLRDLTEDHIPMLKDMLDNGPKVIASVYGVKVDQLRIFVHYQPQFYHFHVHFTRLENDTGAQAEKAHLLADIIQNLEMDSEYYQKRTMTCKLSLKDKLYNIITASRIEE
jgi:m7GpppX diphosphatase